MKTLSAHVISKVAERLNNLRKVEKNKEISWNECMVDLVQAARVRKKKFHFIFFLFSPLRFTAIYTPSTAL